jgi:hypothetical protein
MEKDWGSVPTGRRLGHGEGPPPGRKMKRLGLWPRELKKSRSAERSAQLARKSKPRAKKRSDSETKTMTPKSTHQSPSRDKIGEETWKKKIAWRRTRFT